MRVNLAGNTLSVVARRFFNDEKAVVLGCGPSLNQTDCRIARERGFFVIGVNNSYRLIKPDLLYFCDLRFYNHYCNEIESIDCEKWTQEERLLQNPGLNYIKAINEDGFSLNPNEIHTGGNGGYQAINLALLLGFRKIALLGFDLSGSHFFGYHPVPLNNPGEFNFKNWNSAFNTTIETLKKINAEVINCSRKSSLFAYKKDQIETVFNDE